MWDVFKCIKSSPEVLRAIILVQAIISAPTVFCKSSVTVVSSFLFESAFLKRNRPNPTVPQSNGLGFLPRCLYEEVSKQRSGSSQLRTLFYDLELELDYEFSLLQIWIQILSFSGNSTFGSKLPIEAGGRLCEGAVVLFFCSPTVKKAVELLDAPLRNTFLKSNKNNSNV